MRGYTNGTITHVVVRYKAGDKIGIGYSKRNPMDPVANSIGIEHAIERALRDYKIKTGTRLPNK
jgi:hypothetical protein